MLIASNRPFPNRDVASPSELNERLKKDNHKYIFFPFWSWKVPQNIIDKYTCMGFHAGPYAGGSPIQNLIKMNVNHTVIRMFQMTDKIDGGTTISESPICLNGSLEEIIIRMTETIKDIIDAYVQTNFR